jgi:hypothetical protein
MYFTINDPILGYESITISGHARPAYIVEAREAMEEAWQLYYAAVDTRDQIFIQTRRENAEYLEARYHRLYRQWNNAKGEALEAMDGDCTCSPDPNRNSLACPACIAQAEARNEGGIPWK